MAAPERGHNIVKAISDMERKKRQADKADKKQGTTIDSSDGQLITISNPKPLEGCVPEKTPCGACAGCKHRAALKTALTFKDPAERAAVLARLGLALLVEPDVRGPHTSPLLSEAARAALSAEAEVQQKTIDTTQEQDNQG